MFCRQRSKIFIKCKEKAATDTSASAVSFYVPNGGPDGGDGGKGGDVVFEIDDRSEYARMISDTADKYCAEPGENGKKKALPRSKRKRHCSSCSGRYDRKRSGDRKGRS